MAQTTSSTFLGLEKPMTHYIPLWLIVVFVFFVVVLCTMGGLQEGLAKRQFPDTKVNGDLEVTGDLSIGDFAFAGTLQGTTATVGALNANVDLNLGVQPANTTIRSVYIRPNSVLTTGNNAADELDFSMGTQAGGQQIVAISPILDGLTVTMPAGFQYPLILNGRGAAANALDIYGDGTNPVTSSAVAPLLLSTLTPRNLFVRFTGANQALAAQGTVTVTVVFERIV